MELLFYPIRDPPGCTPSHESTTTSNANADLPLTLLLPRDEYDAAISRFYCLQYHSQNPNTPLLMPSCRPSQDQVWISP